MHNIGAVVYEDTREAGNRIATVILDAEKTEDWEWFINVNGTDENGDPVRPQYVSLDNYSNGGDVEISIDKFSNDIAPYTSASFGVSPLSSNLLIGAFVGTVTVYISENKVPLNTGSDQSRINEVSGFLRRDGAEPMIGDIDMGGHSINNLAGFNTISSISNLTPVDKARIYSTIPGKQGNFIFSATDLSAQVTADPSNGLYIPPNSDLTGASGAWIRQFDGPAISTWWGVSQTASSAANTAAFNAALAALKSLVVTGQGYGHGSIGLHTPAGNYNQHGELTVTHGIKITGDYQGGLGSGATNFIWDTPTTNGFNLIGYDGVSNNAAGTTIDGFLLKGAGLNAGAEGEFHAVKFTARCNIKNCMADSWAGDGFNGRGNFAGNDGNCNDSFFENIAAQNCRWTLSLDGADANACKGVGISAVVNRRGQINDSSFLGNHFFGGEVEGCCTVPGFVSRCHVAGHIYMVNQGQEAGAAVNAPTGAATSNTWWIYLLEGAPSASQPTWAAGLTWIFASPFTNDSPDASGTIAGMHIEPGQNACIMTMPYKVIEGFQGEPVLNIQGFPYFGRISTVGPGMTFGGINVDGTPNEQITFISSTSNILSTIGQLFYQSGAHNFRSVAGVTYGTVGVNGFAVPAGGVYKVNAIQVVGAQQPAIANDASGAVNQATVNAILTALRTHGLIHA